MVPLAAADKKPVFLTAENFHRVHEPKEHSGTIKVEFSESNLRIELPPVVEKFNGYWGETEESRILYLRNNFHLWGWIKEKDVKRRIGCFFIPKKEGDPRLRKILACIDANNCMKDQVKPFCLALGIFPRSGFENSDSGQPKAMWRLFIPPWFVQSGSWDILPSAP